MAISGSQLLVGDIVLISVSIIFYIGVFITSILWNYRRKQSPLNARIYFFTLYFTICTLIWVFLLTWLLTDKNSKDYSWYYAVLAVVQWMVIPFYLNWFIWVAWRIYFVYMLTGTTRIQSFSDIVVASKLEIHSQIAHSLESIDDSLYEGNWFVKRRKYISDSFVIKSFFITLLVEVVVFGSIGYGLQTGFSSMVSSIAFSILMVVHFIFLIVLAVKLRKVRDGFGIKTELKATAIWWILVCIGTFVSARWLGQDVLIVVLGGFIGAYGTVIVYPLIKSYRNSDKSKKLICDAEMSINFTTLDGVMDDPLLQNGFKDFVSKVFLIEEFFFLLKIKEFKSNPELQMGRALLLYQKFIKPGSFLDLRLHREDYAEVEEICQDEQKAMTPGVIHGNFFDKIEKCTRCKLEPFLLEFRRSPEYKVLVEEKFESLRLVKGLSSIGVV